MVHRDQLMKFRRWKSKEVAGEVDPETARESHDETLPQEGAKDRALLFYVCPAFLVYEDYRRCS